MTINEYNELYDQLCYGHEAEISYDEKKYFFEWEELKIIIYNITGNEGLKVTEVEGKDNISIVDKLFNLPIWNNSPLNKAYSNIEIVDIE